MAQSFPNRYNRFYADVDLTCITIADAQSIQTPSVLVAPFVNDNESVATISTAPPLPESKQTPTPTHTYDTTFKEDEGYDHSSYTH